MSYPEGPLQQVACLDASRHHGHTHYIGDYANQTRVHCPGRERRIVEGPALCICSFPADGEAIVHESCPIHGIA